MLPTDPPVFHVYHRISAAPSIASLGPRSKSWPAQLLQVQSPLAHPPISTLNSCHQPTLECLCRALAGDHFFQGGYASMPEGPSRAHKRQWLPRPLGAQLMPLAQWWGPVSLAPPAGSDAPDQEPQTSPQPQRKDIAPSL